ncbi:MAG: hypothetical protein A2046_15180 [Bacteroidetes bacterium GWA2_30_7]|nr:MAG: hypothetical protein A2046_15180 [Bacteroidetes bacterium GWA2_30_7]
MKATIKNVLFALFVAVSISAIGQNNPFEKFGYTPGILTLSNGEFEEFFDSDTIVQIGSALYNTKSKHVIGFIEKDTIYSETTLEPEIVSRWLSPDPLAAKYPYWSPYNFAGNTPIQAIDLEGLEIYYAADGSYIGIYGESTEIRVVNANNVELVKDAILNHADYEPEYFEGYVNAVLSEKYNDEVHTFSPPDRLLIINRDIETENSTTSEFKMINTWNQETVVSGFMLEPAGPSTTESGQDKRIPAGYYDLEEHSGTNYKGVPKLSNSEVSAGRAILIHYGNYPDNTSGCQLPGSTRTTDFVGGNSKAKSTEINNAINSAGYENTKEIIREDKLDD